MRHSTRRALGAIAGVAAATLTLSACAGGGTEPSASDGDFTPLSSVKLQLQWLPQAQFAGYYVALDKGYFQEEGFDDVEVLPSGGDIVPQDALVAGDVDFAVAWVPKVLGTLENQGVELTDIAQVFQKSGTTQVSWKDSDITGVDDFEGKRIGSWGFGNEWEIFAAMADKGLDASTVQITTQDFSMNALLDRDVDAAQAMTYNELAQLFETVNPATGKLYTEADVDVISYEDTAGAMLQDAIWADTQRLADDPAYADAAKRFLKAVVKGWVFARDNPTEAAEITYAAATAPGVDAFPRRTDPSAVADERGQQAHLDRRRVRHDRLRRVGQDGRRSPQGRQPGRPQPHHHRARRLGVLERLHRGGAQRAEGRGRHRRRRLHADRGDAHRGRQVDASRDGGATVSGGGPAVVPRRRVPREGGGATPSCRDAGFRVEAGRPGLPARARQPAGPRGGARD